MSKLMCRSKGIFALFFLQDGNPILGDCKVIISLSTLRTVAALNDLGYSIENCDESLGIYYEKKRGITTSTNFPSHPTYSCEQELSTPVRLYYLHMYLMIV